MNKPHPIHLAVFTAAILLAVSIALFAADTTPSAQPFVKHQPPDTVHYVPIFEENAFESGCVTLQPGDSGTEHSSVSWQEVLVVLQGQGEVIIAGEETLPIEAGDAVYIPRQTVHQLHCTGETALQYVYVAARTDP